MEPLPTVEDIYRDEIRLDEFITADLKALVKSFRRAYEKVDGVDFTSGPMKLSSSKEIRAMAVKFLEEGIAADPRTKQKEVPAANTLWVRARGSFLEYRADRNKILASLSRLFARQNRYRDRNVNARGEQRPNEADDIPPSVEDPDLPDVDDILRAKGPTQLKNKEGKVPQTRSGRPYNNDPLIANANSTGVDGSHAKLAAPVATMTQGPSWGCFASSGIDSKPPKNLTSENMKPGTSVKSTVAGADFTAKQTPQITSPNKKRHAYVTSDNEESDNVNSFNQDSALAEALAAFSDVTQGEVESIIEDAIRQMDPKQPESNRQETRASHGQPPSKSSILESEQLKKRKQPEPIQVVVETASNDKIQSTQPRTSGDKASTAGERVTKRPKIVNKISDAYKVSKPENDRTQINNKPTGSRPEGSSPAQAPAKTVSSLPAGTAPSEAGAPNSAADVKIHLRERLKRPSGIYTNPRLATRMLLSRRKPARRSSHPSHQGLRAHTLPPNLDRMAFEKPKAHENSSVVERASPSSAKESQDSHLEVAAATGTDGSLRSRGDREMSQTLEPEPLVQKSALEQSPTQGNLTPSPPRKPRIAVQLWILEARVPKVAWTQWADASLSAQTVTTIFRAVDEVSQFRNVDTAHVRFQTDEQIWTYTIRKDDPDHFEDMKRSITADIKATTRRNRNNNNDFKIFIEPVGVAETSGDDGMGDVDDEIIPGL